MKTLFNKWAFIPCLFFSISVFGQQLTHPMLVEFTHPASISGSYDYGFQTDWGPTALTGAVTGQVDWAYDITPDSICCDSIPGDLTGKIPIIRRGACNFSLKALNAEKKGAVGCIICNNLVGAGTINMAGGTFGAQVTIPSVFLSYEDCALLDAALQNGDSLSVTFRKPFLTNPISKFAYETPLQHVIPLDSMSIDLLNAGSTPATNVAVQMKIIDPLGTSNINTVVIPSIGVDQTTSAKFTYTPSMKGTFQIQYTTSLANDTIFDEFVVGDTTWALDENKNFTWIGVTDAGFSQAGFRFDMGNSYITGGTPSVVRWATFALDNGATYFGERFTLYLYDITGATGSETDYSTFSLIGANAHFIAGPDTTPNALITVPLYDAVTGADSVPLNANSQYLLIIEYAGNGSIATSPRFTYSGRDDYISIGSVVYTDRLYMGGFTGGYKALIRLHMGTNSTITPIKQSISLNQSLEVYPNPTSERIFVDLDLTNQVDRLQLSLVNLNGKVIEDRVLEYPLSSTHSFNTKGLPSGTYLIRVIADDQYTVKKFTVH